MGAVLIAAAVYGIAKSTLSPFFTMAVLVAIARPAGRFICSLARPRNPVVLDQKNLVPEDGSPGAPSA